MTVTWDAAHLGSHAALSNANLTLAPTNAQGGASIGTTGYSSGRKYFELSISDLSSDNQFQNWGVVELAGLDLEFPHVDSNRYRGCVRYGFFGGGGHWDQGAMVLGFAVDFSTGRLTVYDSGGVFASVPNAILFGTTVYPFAFAEGGGTSDNITANFGATAFALTMPSGFASWDGSQGDDSAAPAAPVGSLGYHSSNVTLSNGNLTATTTSTANCGAVGKAVKYSGKYYFEAFFTTCAGLDGFGIIGPNGDVANFGNDNHAFWNNGVIRNQNNTNDAFVSAYAAGARIGVAVDLDNNKIWYRVGAGVWNNGGTANPATNVGGFDIASINSGLGVWPWMNFEGASGDVGTMIFDSAGFANAAPSGFSPWSTSDSLLQYEWGSHNCVASGDMGAGAITSNNYNSLDAGRLLVVDVISNPGSGHVSDTITITDTAGLVWTKRQDANAIGTTGAPNRFVRFWAYAPSQLTSWNFTLSASTTGGGQGGTFAYLTSWQNADYVEPFDAGNSAGPTPTFNYFSAATSNFTSTAIDPQAEEIVVLGTVFYGGSGFDVGAPTTGHVLEVGGRSTFSKVKTAGKHFSAGVASTTFTFPPHSGDTYALATDAIRLNLQTGLVPVTISDDGGITATLQDTTLGAITIADDLGLSATLTAAFGFATFSDDLGLTATLSTSSPAPPIQQVVICV